MDEAALSCQPTDEIERARRSLVRRNAHQATHNVYPYCARQATHNAYPHCAHQATHNVYPHCAHLRQRPLQAAAGTPTHRQALQRRLPGHQISP